MSEELAEDPEAEPADREGDDDDEDGRRWACYSDAAGSFAVRPGQIQMQSKGMTSKVFGSLLSCCEGFACPATEYKEKQGKSIEKS